MEDNTILNVSADCSGLRYVRSFYIGDTVKRRAPNYFGLKYLLLLLVLRGRDGLIPGDHGFVPRGGRDSKVQQKNTPAAFDVEVISRRKRQRLQHEVTPRVLHALLHKSSHLAEVLPVSHQRRCTFSVQKRSYVYASRRRP